METHYKTFVSILKDAVENMGSYAPIEAADVDAVLKTVIDVSCTAWKNAMQGVKTGDSKSIMKIEKRRAGIIRVIEDRELPQKDGTEVLDPEQVEGKTEEEKKEIKWMLCKFWDHIRKAHKEAACGG